MDPARNSSELIAKAQSGDDHALEQLIRAYQRRVAGMIFSLIGDDHELEDVCQQVFVKLALRLNRLKKVQFFEPWLFTMARNAAFDHLRRRRRRSIFTPWRKVHESIAAESPADSNSRTAALEAAIQRLPCDDRDLLAIIHKHDWTYAQLALTTGHTVGALKTRLSRTRRRIRQLIAEAESK